MRIENNNGSLLFASFLGCALTLSICMNIAIPSIVVCVFYIIVVLNSSRVQGTSVLFLLVPFASTLPFDMLCFIFVFCTFIREKKYTINKKMTIILTAFIAIEVIAELRHGGTFKSSLIFSSYLIVATTICLYPYTNQERQTMQKYFIVGIFCAIISTAIIALKSSSVSSMLSWRLGMAMPNQIYPFTIGSNGLGLMCMLAANILIVFILNNVWRKIFEVPLLIFMLIAGLLTQSRGFLVGLAASILFFAIVLYKERKLKLRYVVFVTVLSAVVIFLYYHFFAESAIALTDRFIENSDDISNGRLDINGYYISNMFNNILSALWGYGLFAYKDYLGGESIHNATLECFISWGIIGGLVSIYWITELIKKRMHNSGSVIKNSVVPVAIILLMVQSTRLFRTVIPVLYLTIGITSIISNESDDDLGVC